MNALTCHRKVGKTKSRQNLVVAGMGDDGNTCFKAPRDFLTSIKGGSRLCIVSEYIGTDAAPLFFDPLAIIARESVEDSNEPFPINCSKHLHVEMALFDHLAHCR